VQASCLVAAAVLAAALVLPARAGDVGPHADLRAIRGSAPILLGHFLSSPVAIGDAVVDGDAAVVTWRAGGVTGLATFARRSAIWWLVASYDTGGPAVGRTSAQLANDLAIPVTLARLLEAHVPGIDALQPIERRVTQPDCVRCGPELWNDADGFEATLHFNAGEAWDPSFAIRGRAPSAAEMPPTPNVDGYYFFRLAAPKGALPVRVREGATLDVWFPFVFDAAKHYILRLSLVEPDPESIEGTLRDNTLHFTLPAFATIPGSDAFGEIDGD
jgi:hypothetical protein